MVLEIFKNTVDLIHGILILWLFGLLSYRYCLSLFFSINILFFQVPCHLYCQSLEQKKDFSFVINHIMRFKTKEIIHCKLPSLCNPIKHFLPRTSFILTYWSSLNQCRKSRYIANKTSFHKQSHRKNGSLQLFSKPVLWHCFRKITEQMGLNIAQIKVFSGSYMFRN
jgi:hypothetical protein